MHVICERKKESCDEPTAKGSGEKTNIGIRKGKHN